MAFATPSSFLPTTTLSSCHSYSTTPPSANRLAVIGAGSVGSSIAYTAVLKHLVSEVLLVDIDQPRCEAQVLDISDCAFLSETKIRQGTFQEAGQCDIIVITAGANQSPSETRLELIGRNYNILQSCISSMKPLHPKSILLLAANPVDILTYFAQKLSGLPAQQVLGSGTFLDSARLRVAIGSLLEVSETAVHAYVLGEHGDSQFVAWSSAQVSTIPISQFSPFNNSVSTVDDVQKLKTQLAHEVKTKAYKIIDIKGATHYGIAGCAASICESILRNTSQIRPVSHFIPSLGVCLSLPCVLGSKGVRQSLLPPLDEKETEKLKSSAASLKQIIDKYEALFKQL